MTTLSLIQTQLNNSLNASIDLTSNEICYEFKIRDHLMTLFVEKIKKEFEDSKKLKKMLNETKFKNCQEAIDAIIFVNVKFKKIFNRRHKSLMLQSKEEVFLRLNKNYKLFAKVNSKLSQQKNDFFTIKKRVEKNAYKLKLLAR